MSCHSLNNGTNLVSQVSQGISTCARSLGHITFSTTATVAHLLGCTVLTAGTVASGVLAYDSYQWMNGSKPIWAKLPNRIDESLPLLTKVRQICTYESGNRMCTHDSIENGIAVGVVASLVLAIGTPLVAYSCFKISKLVNQLDQDLFRKVD